MKKFILLLTLVSLQYNVLEGDTIQSIAEKFCNSNNKIEVAIFREGIREINYDIIGNREVTKGITLQINRFEEM